VSGSWPSHPLVYEINTRVWLGELSRRTGAAVRLDSVPDEPLDELARLGFDAVWLMGVWTTGAAATAVARRHAGVLADCRRALPDLTDDDVVGSPYAISAYSVPAALGGDSGLAGLRERLARRGLRLLLDFVPNHTALDHPLTLGRPDAYMAGDDGHLEREPGVFFRTADGRVLAHGRDPYFPPWSDTAQVNAAHPAGRAALLEWLLAVAERCDGARCDMAMLLLPEVLERTWGERLGPERAAGSFWREAIAALRRRHPGFLLLAEAYWGLEGRLLDEGFDYVYDKTLYDRLRDQGAESVREHLSTDPGFQARLCRFVENHDEDRAAEAFGVAGSLAAAAVALCAPGMKLVHQGQLEGCRVRVPVQLARRPQEPPEEQVQRFYRELLPALAARRGEPRLAAIAATERGDRRDLVAIAWHGGLCAANLGAHPAAGRIEFEPPEAAPGLRLTDRLSEGLPAGRPTPVRLSCELELPPRGVRLLQLDQP
jgi:hypothetical protein